MERTADFREALVMVAAYAVVIGGLFRWFMSRLG